MMLARLLVLSFALFSFASGSHDFVPLPKRRLSHHQALSRRANATSGLTLVDNYKGQDFFDKFNFFTAPDPTHGNVQYVGKDDAQSKRLAFVDGNGSFVMTVDNTTVISEGANRNSVRIQSQKSYSSGLFLFDINYMPYGCGVWPAFWSVGPNWPNGGEIDIIEGVNTQPTNQWTLHSGSACTLSTNNLPVRSQVMGTQCLSSNGNNAGCGFLDQDTRSFGKGLSESGGGVFAVWWTADGIFMWFFPRADVPADITNGAPMPSTWGSPSAFWSAQSCDIAKNFYDHTLIINTSVCGDWTNSAFAQAGCPGTCAQTVADPKNFATAAWGINYLAVYQ